MLSDQWGFWVFLWELVVRIVEKGEID